MLSQLDEIWSRIVTLVHYCKLSQSQQSDSHEIGETRGYWPMGKPLARDSVDYKLFTGDDEDISSIWIHREGNHSQCVESTSLAVSNEVRDTVVDFFDVAILPCETKFDQVRIDGLVPVTAESVLRFYACASRMKPAGDFSCDQRRVNSVCL